MRVVNKKLWVITIMILVVIESVFTYLSVRSYSNKDITKEKEETKINKEMFSMYVEQEDGSYKKYTNSNSLTIAGYTLNIEKSSCVDNKGVLAENSISYNDGKVTIRSNKTLYCHLYYSFPPPDVTINLSGTTGTNQIGKYTKTVDCGDTASGTFNPIYQRVEISSGNTPVKCTLKYTADTNTYTNLKDKVESDNQICNNGCRYSGKSPANWVWFNGEKWRIIGSIPVKQGDGTTSYLVKIIRADSIGTYAYDASSTDSSSLKGAWGSNTLYSLLNTHYYATDALKMNGQSHAGCYSNYSGAYQPKPNCDYSEIGILSSSYYGKMVKNVYWNTGASSTSVTSSAAYTNEIKTKTVSGYIGLMSASDFGYAASRAYLSTSMSSYSAATTTSWMFNGGEEWTSIQRSDSASHALFADGVGYLNYSYASSGYAVRPVLYLDSSVYIIDGDGSEGSPYQIGM